MFGILSRCRLHNGVENTNKKFLSEPLKGLFKLSKGSVLMLKFNVKVEFSNSVEIVMKRKTSLDLLQNAN